MTYDPRELQALPLDDEWAPLRPGGFLCLGCCPGPDPRPRHGVECWGRSCPCRCRSMLGLNGPDVAADGPAEEDQLGVVA